MSHPVDVAGLDGAAIERVALAAETLALVTDAPALVVRTGALGTRAGTTRTLPLPVAAASLALSASGRYALLVDDDAQELAVLDLSTGGQVFAASAVERRRHRVAAAFVEHAGEEVLLFTRERHWLEAVVLPDASPLLRAGMDAPIAFAVDALVPLGGASVAALGHQDGETKDSFVVLDVAALRADPGAAQRTLRDRTRPSDYAYRLAVGRGADGTLVAFRDPEDDERPEEGEDGEAREDREAGEEPEDGLADFRGLYVRRLADGALVERIAYDAGIETGAPLFATTSRIVVGCEEHVELVPRAPDGGPPARIPALAYAMDPTQGRLVTVGDRGELVAHDLAVRQGVEPDERRR